MIQNTLYGTESCSSFVVTRCWKAPAMESMFYKAFMCTYCGQYYPTLNQRRIHTVKHRLKYLRNKSKTKIPKNVKNAASSYLYIHQCDYCNLSFYSISYLESHIKNRHSELTAYGCSYCKSASFRCCDSYINHVESHLLFAPYQCAYCKKCFAENSELGQHVKDIHVREKPYSCKLCCESFADFPTLSHHAEYIHRHSGPYRCHICRLRYNTAADLTFHVDGAHGNGSMIRLSRGQSKNTVHQYTDLKDSTACSIKETPTDSKGTRYNTTETSCLINKANDKMIRLSRAQPTDGMLLGLDLKKPVTTCNIANSIQNLTPEGDVSRTRNCESISEEEVDVVTVAEKSQSESMILLRQLNNQPKTHTISYLSSEEIQRNTKNRKECDAEKEILVASTGADKIQPWIVGISQQTASTIILDHRYSLPTPIRVAKPKMSQSKGSAAPLIRMQVLKQKRNVNLKELNGILPGTEYKPGMVSEQSRVVSGRGRCFTKAKRRIESFMLREELKRNYTALKDEIQDQLCVTNKNNIVPKILILKTSIKYIQSLRDSEQRLLKEIEHERNRQIKLQALLVSTAVSHPLK